MSKAIQHMSEHVLKCLDRHRRRFPSGAPPLLVGVQGPQGSGKTYLTSHLRDSLKSHSLNVAVLSIDDLYLPHAGLTALANTHPHNALLHGRGQPGTHDVPLGTAILNGLRRINDPGSEAVTVPIFEKSLHGGEGDRLEQGIVVRGPLDVVVMEGWCMGFYPVSHEHINKKWEEPVLGLEGTFNMKEYRKDDILEINEILKDYVKWWSLFDAFIQIKPIESSPYIFIYKWRLEQENYMKSHNGGKGMTDEQVKRFVDRYIPGYVFFGQGVTEGTSNSNGAREAPSWIGSGLKVTIGEDRNVVDLTNF